MKKAINTLPKPFNFMLENYNYCKNNLPPNQKSGHWDIFPEDYEKSIEQIDAWKTFLRNPLSLGFNDSLIPYDNARFSPDKKYNGIDPWQRRKEHNYEILIEENITNPKEQENIIAVINLIFSICGSDFTLNNIENEIGSPQKYLLSYKSKNFYCNAHDLSNIYYFWQISRTADVFLKSESPVIAEIGAGYGGIISKAKKKYPKARFVIFDLPELSAVQTFYIYNAFPKSKFFYLKDLIERGDKIFNEEFDFMILPGWMINKVPDKYFDLIINMRSMMEMSFEIINFYFKHIHRTAKNGSLFACFNRYHKKSHSEENIIMKNYPFDEFWIPVISQTSIYQNHIHDLILKRQENKSKFHIREILKSLPPF